MSRLILFILTLAITSKCFSVQVSNRTPSFDCSKSSNYVEELICEKNSYQLKRLDNRMLIEYKTLSAKVHDKNDLRKQQLQWLKSRNLCKTKECLIDSYNNRLILIRKEAISLFKISNETCFTAPYDAIFREAAITKDVKSPEKYMKVFYATSDGMELDIDLDGKADPKLTFNGAQELCGATNCWSESKIFLKINGCYKPINASFLRSGYINPEKLEKRILDIYKKGNYPKNIAVLTSYNVSGCAGSSGTRYYSALDTSKMAFETFVSIDYECDAKNDYKQVETKFWSKKH